MIKKIKYNNFLNFTDKNLKFSPNINIITGGTEQDRTHLINLLFATLQAYKEASMQDNLKLEKIIFPNYKPLTPYLKKWLEIVFPQKPMDTFSITMSIKLLEEGYLSDISLYDNAIIFNEIKKFNFLFIPPVLYLETHKSVDTPFISKDPMHIELNKKLSSNNNEENINTNIHKLIYIIEYHILIRKIQYNSQIKKFIYKDPNSTNEHIPNGLIAMEIIPTLLKQGIINPSTILVIQSPEIGLYGPKISLLFGVLAKLSETGIQVFISTENQIILKKARDFAHRNFLNLKYKIFSLVPDKTNPDYIDLKITNL